MKEGGCKPNLSVVFTPQPQAYLDAIHEKNMDVVGYHGTTKVSHAIQAWYVTGIRDIRGVTVVDHDVMQASLSCANRAAVLDPSYHGRRWLAWLSP